MINLGNIQLMFNNGFIMKKISLIFGLVLIGQLYCAGHELDDDDLGVVYIGDEVEQDHIEQQNQNANGIDGTGNNANDDRIVRNDQVQDEGFVIRRPGEDTNRLFLNRPDFVEEREILRPAREIPTPEQYSNARLPMPENHANLHRRAQQIMDRRQAMAAFFGNNLGNFNQIRGRNR